MRTVLVIPGDGVGPEVIGVARRAIETMVPSLELLDGVAGREAMALGGEPVAPETVALLADGGLDGVLFGATQTEPGEPSAVLALRRFAKSRCNIRPALSRGHGDPRCNVTVYREMTEDLYVQRERETREGAVAERPITRGATQRFASLALDHAAADARLVVAHKSTVLPVTDGLFVEVVQEEARRRGRAVAPRLVDSLAHDLVRNPGGPLAVLAPNLYGDILSDVTAALAGGLGLAPSLTLGDGPAVAEPVHGSAPDIAGRGVANPAAALLSAALLLAHLGHRREAQAIETATTAALADSAARTPDVGGRGTTRTFEDAVLAQLEVTA